MKLKVVLPEEIVTKGSVLIHQVKPLDFDDRQLELIENKPELTVSEVTQLAKAISL